MELKQKDHNSMVLALAIAACEAESKKYWLSAANYWRLGSLLAKNITGPLGERLVLEHELCATKCEQKNMTNA